MPFTEHGWIRPGFNGNPPYDAMPSDDELRALPMSDLIRLATTGLGLYALGVPFDETRQIFCHAEVVIAHEIDRRMALALSTTESIAAYVQGDGSDAARIALADGIREGRST